MGCNNMVVIDQFGNNNGVGIIQVGDGYNVFICQSGNGNVMLIIQGEYQDYFVDRLVFWVLVLVVLQVGLVLGVLVFCCGVSVGVLVCQLFGDGY